MRASVRVQDQVRVVRGVDEQGEVGVCVEEQGGARGGIRWSEGEHAAKFVICVSAERQSVV